MTKLYEVVRGVEVKELAGYDEPYSSINRFHQRIGYNSLASAEVVVDREKIANIFLDWDRSRQASGSFVESVSTLANSIATAIESGSTISLKGEK